MSDEKNTLEKIKKHRSPNYPYISLGEAIDRARDLQAVGGIHPVIFSAAMHAWNYKSGTANSVTAALKSFGLVEITGNGDKRQLRVTEAARKILDDHSDTAELLKQAALSPSLYKELWDKYNGNLPPSDKIISEYLKFERGFNPSVVDAVIKDFRATIAYASLSPSDTIEPDGGEPDGDKSENNALTNTGNTGELAKSGGSGHSKPSVLGKGVMFNITIDVLENGQINVNNGGTLTAETFAILSEIFKLKEKHEKITESLKGNRDHDMSGEGAIAG